MTIRKLVLATAASWTLIACSGNYAPEEAIKGSEVNREAFPNVRGTGGSGSDEEAIKGSRANPKYLEEVKTPDNAPPGATGAPNSNAPLAPARE